MFEVEDGILWIGSWRVSVELIVELGLVGDMEETSLEYIEFLPAIRRASNLPPLDQVSRSSCLPCKDR